MFRRAIPPFCICICIQWWQEQCWEGKEGQSPLLSFLYFCLRDSRRKAPQASSFSRNPVPTSKCKSYTICTDITTILELYSNIIMQSKSKSQRKVWILLSNIEWRCFVARTFLLRMYALFGGLFTGLNNQKLQMLGMGSCQSEKNKTCQA